MSESVFRRSTLTAVMSFSPLWTPPTNSNSYMNEFMHFVERKRQLHFDGDYHKFYTWSLTRMDQFWCDFFYYVRPLHSAPPLKAIESTANMSSIPTWFPGCRLNYAENLLLAALPSEVAVYSFCEGQNQVFSLTYGKLREQVRAVAWALRESGVAVGDRVAGILPNGIEAVVCYLATAYIGAIWSSASPDFGVRGIIQRFSMIQPTVLFAVTCTRYRGKLFDQSAKLTEVVQALEPKPHRVILVPYLGLFDDPYDCQPTNRVSHSSDAVGVHFVGESEYLNRRTEACMLLEPLVQQISHSCTLAEFLRCTPSPCDIKPLQLSFSHPLVIMFTSGTTGPPKCILHSAGGTLIKHLCEQKLHCDFRPNDRILYLTNTGWMMWNWLVSALALGSTLVLYDGCPLDVQLWSIIDELGVTALGTSAKWLAVIEDRGIKPGQHHKLNRLRTILSTGSPLAPRSFDFVYRDVKSDLILGSISGGTDMIGCCVGCCPILPVYRGQIQCRFLGMAVESWDEKGQSCWDKSGELVITRPFPSMPIGFWNDDEGIKFRKAYFSNFPNVWAHGDFVELHSSTQGLTISGRSDTTLNPGGIRFGSAEIYNIVESLPCIADSLCVAQSNGDRSDERVVLLVKLACPASNEGPLPTDVAELIRHAIRSHSTPRFLPAVMLSVPAIPYTVNGKKVELAVRRLFEGHSAQAAFAKESLADPNIVELYVRIAQTIGGFT
ncbi:hypothetical protein EG68_03108 [Paragonimus skrjabini miyazakii]|uniref:Acetoacetyl-CoA synthetase n=1 Tax=Paragonimus skrjabini miyazakii TaxID=59628 RepID=A0A8S9Z2W2_9TREM|nr:hypothetical protein EG68_03108 [Paragonimus skrjabini miyazakii]